MTEQRIVQSTDEAFLTKDGTYTMRHGEHGECYHSSIGAGFEARELYIERSGIIEECQKPGRDPLRVLDVGLGLAYNAMATLETWVNSPGHCDLILTSLEVNPDLVQKLSSGEAPWQEGWKDSWKAWSKALSKQGDELWQAKFTHASGKVFAFWNIYLKDASDSPLPEVSAYQGWKGWEFIWQDPFSPKHNPKLWDQSWFKKLAEVASSDALLMTYSVARIVKDGLMAGGWRYELISTPNPGKRNWLRAIKV